jgi:hypothetical protein
LPVSEIRLIQVGTAKLAEHQWINPERQNRWPSPADHDCVVGAINLGMPRSETFVEPRRNEVGQDTLELWTAKE